MKTNTSCATWAFTRLELAVVIATLALLAAVALPVLAGNKLRSEQVSCLSNLRQLGHAVHLWGNDHGDRTPWFTPESEGGTRDSTNALKNNLWFQFGALSNELVSARVLVCPSDQGVGAPRRMADSFSNDPANGGLFAPGFRNQSVSYLIGLHAYFAASRTILSGDRNIRWDALNQSCPVGFPGVVLYATSRPFGPPADVFWTNAIHGVCGNLLFVDGAAEEFSSAGLQAVLNNPGTSCGSSHHFVGPN